MYVIRPTHAGTIPMSTRRNAMNGKSAVASDVAVSDCSTSRACGPATDSPTSDSASTSKRIASAGRQVGEEPPRVVHLGGLRAEQEELVVAGAGDGELADDAAVGVEHRRQGDAARSSAAGW